MTAAASRRSVATAVLLFAVLFVWLMNTVPVSNNDVWLQMRIGRMIVEDHAIPRTVLFPFTPAAQNAFTSHEWVPSILFYEMSRVFGERGLIFAQGLAGLAQFGLAFVLARRRSGSIAIAASGAMIAMVLVNFRYDLRPEVFALAFFTGLLIVLGDVRDGASRHRLWAAPAIGVAWANCHGSFLLGPVLCLIFAGGEALQAALRAPRATVLRDGVRAGSPFLLAAAGMVAASVVNPLGISLLRFAFEVRDSAFMKQRVEEWLPTFSASFVHSPAFPPFAIASLLVLGIVAWRRRRLGATDVLLLLAFGGLALDRNRHIVWFAFAALAVCARALRADPGVDQAGRERVAAAIAGGVAVVGIALYLVFGNVRHANVYGAPTTNLPSAMVAELANPALHGNVFNSYELGAELIYRDWPRLKPVVDSRADSYGDDYLRLVDGAMRDEGLMNAFLKEYHVELMLLLQRDFDNGVSRMASIRASWHIRLAVGGVYLLQRNVPFAPLPAAPAPAASAPA